LISNNPSTPATDARAAVVKKFICVRAPVFVPLFLLGFSAGFCAGFCSGFCSEPVETFTKS